MRQAEDKKDTVAMSIQKSLQEYETKGDEGVAERNGRENISLTRGY